MHIFDRMSISTLRTDIKYTLFLVLAKVKEITLVRYHWSNRALESYSKSNSRSLSNRLSLMNDREGGGSQFTREKISSPSHPLRRSSVSQLSRVTSPDSIPEVSAVRDHASSQHRSRFRRERPVEIFGPSPGIFGGRNFARQLARGFISRPVRRTSEHSASRV